MSFHKLFTILACLFLFTFSSLSQTIDYNFDDLTGLIGTPLSPIATYKSLNFSEWQFIDTDPLRVSYIAQLTPSSFPNYASFFDYNVPSIIAVSPVKTFDAHEVHFGCVFATLETFAALPRSCNMTATGYDVSGAEIAKQTFVFVSNGSLVQEVEYGRFHEGFVGLQRIDWTVGNLLDRLTTGAVIDDFVATLYL